MATFYTNFYQYGNRIYVRGYDMGLRFRHVHEYKPYLFVPKAGGKYKTLDGKSVDKIEFESLMDAKDFIERYSDVENFEIYGLQHFPYLYIFDEFKGDIDYDPKLVNVTTLDIEVGGENIKEYPNIELANQPITLITTYCRGKTFSFGYKPIDTKTIAELEAKNSTYVCLSDEKEMLMTFLETWEQDAFMPDIVTGWNVEFFDIPYIVNRISRLFSETEAKRLSPWKYINKRKVEQFGREQTVYDIYGISILDYYGLYRKFTFGNQESYKLDFIGQVELGERKIAYEGTLNELYRDNFAKYLKYNIQDVILVQKLEEKLKFIEQVMALAYDAKVNYNDTMATVRPWDIIIHNHLLEQGIVIPPMKKQRFDGGLMGGHVKEPKTGLSRWVVSFDLNSLYPHLIMQYNISPEKFAYRVPNFPDINFILERGIAGHPNWLMQEIKEQGTYSIAANGCLYKKDSQGFLPFLMEKMYNDRTKYKKLMLEAKQRYEKSHSAEDAKLIARYHNMQMAKKIQLNSAYGALANQYFRWFDFNLAESITSSGQLTIQWAERKMNAYMNKICKTEDVDYVIASDTDSLYLSFDKLIPEGADPLKAVDLINTFCNKHIEPYMASFYDELAGYMNAFAQKMTMKRETIADKGIWTAKKRYILNAWDVEGVRYEKPKLKLQGIEAVRSSTPHACREKIKEALAIVMNGTQEELQQFISKFRAEFDTLPVADIAYPRGVNGLMKYHDASGIYKLGTPIHVKGALLFNHWIKKYDLTDIQPIRDGDKIKFIHLKVPNPILDTVIAFADDIPKEFRLDLYIDREQQFEKAFLSPLESITSIIGWKLEETSTLEDFFG